MAAHMNTAKEWQKEKMEEAVGRKERKEWSGWREASREWRVGEWSVVSDEGEGGGADWRFV